MSQKNLRGFKEQARNVGYAYEQTQRQFDDHPPNNDVAPIATAINAWTFICGCYMGIEQTMKLLIRMRGTTTEKALRSLSHDLVCLYKLLDPSERKVVADYYRVYRSLHNLDTGDITIETAEEFIRHIGGGYEAWRYILVENQEVPKMHLGMMLETWRALADLVEHRVQDHNYPYRTVADDLEDYIDGVFNDAEMTDEWQAASLDENSSVKFSEIREWIEHKGGVLKAGIDLFNHHARGTGNSIKASPLLRQVLLRAADKAMSGPLPPSRRADIAMFHSRIHSRIHDGGLAWNADKKVFEPLRRV